MSGEGFFVGTAVAAYEWIAALALDHHCRMVYAGVFEEQNLHHAAVPQNAGTTIRWH